MIVAPASSFFLAYAQFREAITSIGGEMGTLTISVFITYIQTNSYTTCLKKKTPPTVKKKNLAH